MERHPTVKPNGRDAKKNIGDLSYGNYDAVMLDDQVAVPFSLLVILII